MYTKLANQVLVGSIASSIFLSFAAAKPSKLSSKSEIDTQLRRYCCESDHTGCTRWCIGVGFAEETPVLAEDRLDKRKSSVSETEFKSEVDSYKYCCRWSDLFRYNCVQWCGSAEETPVLAEEDRLDKRKLVSETEFKPEIESINQRYCCEADHTGCTRWCIGVGFAEETPVLAENRNDKRKLMSETVFKGEKEYQRICYCCDGTTDYPSCGKCCTGKY